METDPEGMVMIKSAKEEDTERRTAPPHAVGGSKWSDDDLFNVSISVYYLHVAHDAVHPFV